MRNSNIIQLIASAAIFIALEIAALAMLYNNGPLQNIWISHAAHSFMGNVWGSTQRVVDYFNLRSTNDELALENHELRTKVAKLEERIAESGINMIESMPDKQRGFTYTPAHVVKISNNTQHNYMILDKGSADGIKEGTGVITSKGAIGIIDAVSENYSYAISFKNHMMSISSRLGRQGTVGPLSWDGNSNNKAVLKEIPHHLEFAQGDTVYTSGYSSIFPPDIPLGTTGEANIVNGATFEIEVELFEDFSAVRYVTIVENLGSKEMNLMEEEQR